MQESIKPQHTWQFKSRFRRNAFGWRGSRQAIERVHEALAEIKVERHRAVFERDRIATWGPHTRMQDWVAFAVSGVDALAHWMREHA